MVRKFVDFDGNVLDEQEWEVSPLHRCFYCGDFLIMVEGTTCPTGMLGEHDFVTLCQKEE